MRTKQNVCATHYCKKNVVYYLAFRKRKDDQHLGGRAP